MKRSLITIGVRKRKISDFVKAGRDIFCHGEREGKKKGG